MHDQNFKNLILDYPVQALEFFAGEEAGSDLSEARIVPVRQEQLMERREQGAGSKEHGARSMGQGAWGKEHGARSMGQGAWGRELRGAFP